MMAVKPGRSCSTSKPWERSFQRRISSNLMSGLSYQLGTLILFLGTSSFSQPRAETNDLQNLLTGVESTYINLQNLQMDFKKEVKAEYFSESQPVFGSLYLKQPNQYRLETAEEIIVSDGKIVWTYLPEAKQVTKQRLKPGEEFNFLSFLKDMQSKYKAELGDVEKVQNLNCRKIILTPKEKGADVEKLIVWVDGKNNLVRKMEMFDLQNSRAIFWFTKVKINHKLDQSQFEFTVPQDVELIDLAQ